MRRLAGFAGATILIAGVGAAGAAEQLSDGFGGFWQPVTGGRIDDAAGGGGAEPAQRLRAQAAARGPKKGLRLVATVRRPTELRANGVTVTTVDRKTVFGGPTMMAVVGRRPGWVAVLHETMPNGRSGWVRTRDVRLTTTPWRLRIDRSDRQAVLYRGLKPVERFTIGIGSPSSPTPVGRYSITDRMVTRGPASVYGCCILALSGRQPYLPSGWRGGDRLAIHGTPGDGDIGSAVTAGCMTARASVLRRLLARLPAGTRVDVTA